MKSAISFVTASLTVCLLTGPAAAADFEKDIRPVLAEFCLKCHSTEKHKGDLDMERFASDRKSVV